MRSYEVTYSVKMKTVIQVPDGGNLEEEVADIDIPDGVYVEGSFTVIEINPEGSDGEHRDA